MLAEAYGPVVLKPQGQHLAQSNAPRAAAASTTTPPTRSTSQLVPRRARPASAARCSAASSPRTTDDEVFSTLDFDGERRRSCRVNWSDESVAQDDDPDHRLGHRRAGSTPTARSARSTCATRRRSPTGYGRAGTSGTPPSSPSRSWFYLRGEEYSAQLDAFVAPRRAGGVDGENDFAERGGHRPHRSALMRADDASAGRTSGTARRGPVPSVAGTSTLARRRPRPRPQQVRGPVDRGRRDEHERRSG